MKFRCEAKLSRAAIASLSNEVSEEGMIERREERERGGEERRGEERRGEEGEGRSIPNESIKHAVRVMNARPLSK